MRRVAIVAALPGELKPLVRGWERDRRAGVHLWRRRRTGFEWVAGCGGLGAAAAVRTLAEIEREGPVAALVSAGWAGALSEDYGPGQAFWVAGVIDAASGERFATAGPGEGWLATHSRVAGPAEKKRLARELGAVLVDMEAAGLARVAARRGLPFSCVKGVSDGPADRLPDFSVFVAADGRFRVFRFAFFALVRPWHWAVLARMGRQSAEAAHALARALIAFLDAEGTKERPEAPPDSA
jgi:adenosylhomocysteine nucleosidase